MSEETNIRTATGIQVKFRRLPAGWRMEVVGTRPMVQRKGPDPTAVELPGGATIQFGTKLNSVSRKLPDDEVTGISEFADGSFLLNTSAPYQKPETTDDDGHTERTEEGAGHPDQRGDGPTPVSSGEDEKRP